MFTKVLNFLGCELWFNLLYCYVVLIIIIVVAVVIFVFIIIISIIINFLTTFNSYNLFIVILGVYE